MPSSTTQDIRVSVQSLYLPAESAPEHGRFVFAYTIEIENTGERPAELRSRHWVITDSLGHVEEVRGEGVVGEQPRLGPDESFCYTSGSVLRTRWGTMHGEYQMHYDDGSSFDADIPAFLLSTPGQKGDTPN